MWQGCAVGLTGSLCGTGSATDSTWYFAISTCWLLSWGGHDDWRLPDIVELRSIAPTDGAAAMILSVFANTPYEMFWSSTTTPSGGAAWISHGLGTWNSAKERTGSTELIRCVRDLP